MVGVSGAGKSTLVAALRRLGWDAHDCAQEHSEVRHMWQAMVHPDVLIYLDASLETIRQRRQVDWEGEVIEKERERLEHARQHADLYLMTDGLSGDGVLNKVMEFLEDRVL